MTNVSSATQIHRPLVEVTGDPVMVVDKGKIELKIEDVRLQLDSSERDQKPDMTILLSPEIDSETAIRCFELAIREVQKHGTFTMKQLLARDLKSKSGSETFIRQ